jgi:hypothetical protein
VRTILLKTPLGPVQLAWRQAHDHRRWDRIVASPPPSSRRSSKPSFEDVAVESNLGCLAALDDGEEAGDATCVFDEATRDG